MDAPHIAFIGAGNMAGSIIGGLLESGHPAGRISAADPFPDSLERLRELGPLHTCADNAEAAATADVIIMAVKPQVMAEATESISAAVAENAALVISIAAGVTVESMAARLGVGAAIVRCMPNTPALLGCGASGLFANSIVSSMILECRRFFCERNSSEKLLINTWARTLSYKLCVCVCVCVCVLGARRDEVQTRYADHKQYNDS